MKDKTIQEMKTAAVNERLRLKQLKRIVHTNGFDTLQTVMIAHRKYYRLTDVMRDASKLIKSRGKLIKLCEELQDERRDKSYTLSS